MSRKHFNGEVWTNTHPDIMLAMQRANELDVDGKVGHDGYSQEAVRLMQAAFDQPVTVTFTYNGTAANILALKSMLRPWDSVLCADCTHINTHEDGAVEHATGCKVLTVPSADGKLEPDDVQHALRQYSGYSYKPRVLVLTQPTEFGVLYTVDELSRLCSLAHENGMYVFVDGARLAHALEALDTTLQAMLGDTGVDAFTFGGTKAGLMFGEMVVFLRPEHGECIEYSQKQSLQHMDKSKFLGVQFAYLLRNEFWRTTAGHANRMAALLAEKLAARSMQPHFPVDTNMVFLRVTPEQLERIRTCFDLGYWDESIGLIRIAMTHDTQPEMIDRLIALL